MENHDNAERVPAAHIVECVSRSISTDRTTAMAVFRIADGTKFAITVPVGGLKELQAMVNDMVTDAAKLDLKPGSVAVKRPKGFAVGNSPQFRGCTILSFDPETDAEAVYALRDEDALNLCKAVGADMMARGLKIDQLRGGASQGALLRPGARKIIIPGQ